MSLSFYEVSVESYLQMLGAVDHIMGKAEECAAAGDLDLDAIVSYRLADDMHPFTFQAVSVWHHSWGAIAGMKAGLFEPPPSVEDNSWSGLRALMVEGAASLAAEDPAAINTLGEQGMVFKGGGMEIPFSNKNFLLSFSLPNFYFHVTTIYDVLRLHGVPLGKLAFMGQMKMGG